MGLSDGLYEYQSSRMNFGINHIIAFGNTFDHNNVYNFIQNKPLYVIYKDFVVQKSEPKKRHLSESEILAKAYTNNAEFDLNILFKFSDVNCFVINYYMFNEKKILFQFLNKSDPNLFEFEKCWVRVVKDEIFRVKNVQLNGVENVRNRNIPQSFLKKRFFAPLDDMSANLLYEKNEIKAQEFYTLAVEFE